MATDRCSTWREIQWTYHHSNEYVRVWNDSWEGRIKIVEIQSGKKKIQLCFEYFNNRNVFDAL